MQVEACLGLCKSSADNSVYIVNQVVVISITELPVTVDLLSAIILQVNGTDN